jgi:epoxyqueuosine reductase
VLIAIGNSGDDSLAPKAKARLADESSLVRGAAVWALSRLLEKNEFKRLRREYADRELDDATRSEWFAD